MGQCCSSSKDDDFAAPTLESDEERHTGAAEMIGRAVGGRTRLLGRLATRIRQPALSLYGSNEAHVR